MKKISTVLLANFILILTGYSQGLVSFTKVNDSINSKFQAGRFGISVMGNAVYIPYVNSTSNAVWIAKSADNGATFTNQYTVQGFGAYVPPMIATYGNNNIDIVGGQGTYNDQYFTSTSSDQGASWNIGSFTIGSSLRIATDGINLSRVFCQTGYNYIYNTRDIAIVDYCQEDLSNVDWIQGNKRDYAFDGNHNWIMFGDYDDVSGADMLWLCYKNSSSSSTYNYRTGFYINYPSVYDIDSRDYILSTTGSRAAVTYMQLDGDIWYHELSISSLINRTKIASGVTDIGEFREYGNVYMDGCGTRIVCYDRKIWRSFDEGATWSSFNISSLIPAGYSINASYVAEYNDIYFVCSIPSNGYYDLYCARISLPDKVIACDFSVNDTSISTSDIAQFTDLSTNTPTSWLWDFGDGNTSSLQNPTHSYQYVGIYTVSLTVSNCYGVEDTETKTSYITVLPPPCDTITNFAGTPLLYLVPSPQIGYVSGNNSYGDLSKAEYFLNYYPLTIIDKVFINFGVAIGSSGNITINVLNQSGGVPGAVAGTATVPLATIVSDVSNSLPTEIDFSPDVTISGPFYIEVVLPTIAGDTVAIYTNAPGEATTNTAWEKLSDNSWSSYQNSWGIPMNHEISVVACPVSYSGPSPVADFSGTPTYVSVGGVVSFTDLSINSPTSWNWDFGDSNTSMEQNPLYSYQNVGVYTVSLIVSNDNGSDSLVKTNYITVDSLVTDFTVDQTNIFLSELINFSDQSNFLPISWSWNFGDGNTSTEQNPSHEYTSAGIYSVSLTATNSTGSDTEIKVDYITVSDLPFPSADFIADQANIDQGGSVTFTDLSNYLITSWLWDFGDGDTSTEQNPTHTYVDFGIYTVSLTVSNTLGTDTETKESYIYVSDISSCPTVINIPWIEGFEEEPLDFNCWQTMKNTSADGGLNGNGLIDVSTGNGDYCWFNNEGPGSQFVHSGSWSAAINYNSPDFNWLISRDIILGAQNHELRFWMWYMNSISQSLHTKFHVMVFVDNIWENLMSWTNQSYSNMYDSEIVLDLSLYSSKTIKIAFVYEQSGGNSLSLDDVSIVYSPVPVAPIAEFIANPTIGYTPLNVTFNDLSTNSPTSWSWDFGDGGTSTIQNPSHTYSATGNYTVSLTATNAIGSDTKIKTNYITVNSPLQPPAADFTANQTSITVGQSVTFYDLSTNSPTIWSWSFGDGGSSTLQNPSHTYNSAGNYTVSLTATNYDGSDTKTKTSYITVNVPCDTLSNILTTNQPTLYGFGAGQWGSWTGHNSYSMSEFAEHYAIAPNSTISGLDVYVAQAYAGAVGGNHKVRFTIYQGGAATPGAILGYKDIGINNISSNSYNNVQFDSPILISASDVYVGYKIYYNTPADTFSVAQTTSSVTNTGYIKYTGTWYSFPDISSGGIVSSIYIFPVVCSNGAPVANFTANITNILPGNIVSFTDQSVNSPTSWNWSFPGGNPSTSNLQNPTVTYNIPGNYNVTLSVSNSTGSDSNTKNNFIIVNNTQSGVFSMDFEDCTDFSITFSPWTVNDMDGSATYGSQDFDYTHETEVMSFIAFNPSSTSPTQSGNAALQPHGGQRFGACFAAVTPPNNDWLISNPLHLGNNSSLSLWVKSFTAQYGLERYKIGVSTTNNNPANFTIISSGPYELAPDIWTQKTYSLSSYDNQNVYIGINCVSNDAFIFMIDDIQINTTPVEIYTISEDNNISVYPIPSSGKFFINYDSIDDINISVKIYDLYGKLIFEQSKVTSNPMMLDLANEPIGIYFARIKTADKIFVKKISIFR